MLFVCVCVCVCVYCMLAELSRLLDQKAYLEELKKELEHVIVIIPCVRFLSFICVFTEHVDLHIGGVLETFFCMFLGICMYKL